ncbi:enolase-phosphatase E1-like isoform X2 [Prorops nasuta]|uniref:enolase-phosphatase E1-like isoform X2 n=1 Tax=Prorops nasuta TaxID=863751 RepID=UPI0034CD5C47
MSGEKRGQDLEETLLGENVILVDIEGTTTSISFVKETLFPYARENLKQYVDTKWEDDEFKKVLQKLKDQAKQDEETKVDGFVPIIGATIDEEKESLVKNVLWQMDCDRKAGALKELQGHMWRDAYESGTVKGHIYEDVPKALEAWTNNGRKVYVYSSGSVEAQKLLFGHSVFGDLSKYFNGYFDTEVGPKQEVNSYKNIIEKIGAEPSNILFLTDIVKEAKAAKEAGLSVNVVVREGNAALTDEEKVIYTTVKSFLDLSFQSSAKRQKLEVTELGEKNEEVTSKDCEAMEVTEDVPAKNEKPEVKSEEKERVEVDKETNSTEPSDASKIKSEEIQTKTEKMEVTDGEVKKVEKEEKTKEEASSVENNNVNEESTGPESETTEAVEKTEDAKPETAETETKKEEKKEEKPSQEEGEKVVENGSVSKEAEEVSVTKEAEKSESKEIIQEVKEKKEEASKSVEKEEKEEAKENKENVPLETKKLNGTTQNGDAAKLEEKLHGTNGIDEETVSEKVVDDEKTKNGESTSSSESDSVKVKKVVDPAVADGEPVPPPVVVAATS